MKITQINAREIIDSRGNPTTEVDVVINGEAFGRAATPSGASTGSKEALEVRDGGERFCGKGVLKAVQNIQSVLSESLINKSFESQRELDEFLISLDGSENKSNLGANAILPVSLAFAKAKAEFLGKHFFEDLKCDKFFTPRPMMNVINGGAHADNTIDFQEFMIIPQNFSNFKESVRAGCEVFHSLKKILHSMNLSTAVGDEGGFAPNLSSIDDCLSVIGEAVENAGYKFGDQIALGLDVAATEFYKDGHYVLNGKKVTTDELLDIYVDLAKKFPIISIEDPFAEFDHYGFKAMTDKLGKKIQIVGDDLFVTNKKLLQEGIENNMCNAILIKPNQIGTLTETLDTIELAQKNKYKCIMSHRSGETEDVSIAHIAIGSGCDQIKTGSLSRSDRVCKYNEIIRIEEYLSA